MWEKLNGIFSIVIFDRKQKKILLIRDHLGVKPLHYFVNNEKIYIGSDYNSFFKLRNYRPSINYSALGSYLSLGMQLGEQTFYKNIFDVFPVTKLFMTETELKIDSIGIYLLKQVRIEVFSIILKS